MYFIMRRLLIYGFTCMGLTLSAFAAAQNTDESPAESVSEPAAESAVPAWTICNETSFILRLAHGQTRAGQGRVSGWQKLRPSECIDETPDKNTPRFLFAESAPVHNGGIREWAGQVTICVNPTENFDIDMTVSCALQGLETRRFLRIDPAEIVTTLIEPDDFKTKAKTAGLQRLMKDAGYKISRIDGIDGRRTRNTLKQFLKDYEIGSDLALFEQMDALEDAALSQQDLVGLTLCNKTQLKTWTAIGYREDGSWQSRGWWPIEPDGCVRLWSKDLTGTEMHIYAHQTTGDDKSFILENPLETVNNFCVAEARFSAIGREFCTDKGYAPANFKAIPTIEKGNKITLAETDFIPASSGGLRR